MSACGYERTCPHYDPLLTFGVLTSYPAGEMVTVGSRTALTPFLLRLIRATNQTAVLSGNRKIMRYVECAR